MIYSTFYLQQNTLRKFHKFSPKTEENFIKKKKGNTKHGDFDL